MKEITFIHAADLHLDSPMLGLSSLQDDLFDKIKESTFAALKNIVDAALGRKVDFVILAGDLFDGEDRSIKAQARLRKEMNRLAEKNIPVYAVHGNHDHFEGTWSHISLPDNVHIFPHQPSEESYTAPNGTTVSLHGFSYPRRHVSERMISQYPVRGMSDFHIGILHGSLEGETGHGRYAPFILKELLDKEYDYWALGHIHKRMVLNAEPPVIYPGNTQGRSRKESGAKGCYHVTLNEAGADFEFLQCHSFRWEQRTVDISGLSAFDEVYSRCLQAVEEERKNGGVILELFLEGASLSPQDMNAVAGGELLSLLQEEEVGNMPFVWVSAVIAEEQQSWDRNQLREKADFFSGLFAAADGFEDFEESLGSLYSHPLARRYAESMEEGEKAVLLKEAEEMLLGLLYKND
ncbi:DNA repair exonuclease [Bacillus sp. OG2]|nr:DNA repair exonuclease [Bacillus sp. OG2]